jgi:diadenosine tetraphosphate (Ap4A) HIT family hydrolase
MSMPIVYCSIVKALESPQVMENLKKSLKYNLEKGYFSVWPCKHNPQCRDLTEQEQDQILKMMEDIQKEVLDKRQRRLK